MHNPDKALNEEPKPTFDWTASPDIFSDPADEKPFELPPGNAEEARALLKFWREDVTDTEEQRETMEYLKRVLDEDRLSDRKLFP